MIYTMYTRTLKKKIGFASSKLLKSRTPPQKYVILNISASRALRNLSFEIQVLWCGDYSQNRFSYVFARNFCRNRRKRNVRFSLFLVKFSKFLLPKKNWPGGVLRKVVSGELTFTTKLTYHLKAKPISDQF